MLDSLSIKNFRLFKELTIEHLGRVNLFVGRNNSGKTCLLEALWIYGSNADPAILKKMIAQRDENWEFNNLNLEYEKNHPLQYIYHNYYSPVFEPITISSLDSSRQVLSICLNETEKYLPELGLVFENYSESKKRVSWLFKDYPAFVNFPHFPNKERTQFVGTTAMESQEVEYLWNQIFVTLYPRLR
jgi:predicted ATP-dependent endonuclease of OLD family